jgi:glucose-6-phosphate 1-epimerase
MDTQQPGMEWIRSERGEVCTQGAQVVRWRFDGSEVLFVGRKARFEPGQAIRGGIPVIFPWFGDDPQKLGRGAHGFARRLAWRVVERSDAKDATRVVLELEDSDATRALWPQRFLLRLEAQLGAQLELALTVTNRGDEPFEFEEALHSYFQVGDVRAISLRGLEGSTYLDKLDGFARKRASNEPQTFTGPVDNVHLDTESACEIEDIVHGRTLALHKRHSRSTVVWNPWVEGAQRLSDLGDEDWAHFLCVETANIGANAVQLAAGASHTMELRVEVS